MASKFLLLLVIIALSQETLQDNGNNKLEVGPDQSAVSTEEKTVGESNVDNIGDMISNFMQSDGGKQIGDMLLGAVQNKDVTAQVLQGLGSLMQQKSDESSGIDPSLMGNILSMLGSQEKTKESDGFDIGSMFSTLTGLISESNSENTMGFLPMIMSALKAFVGPEADATAARHAGHAWMLPPVVEKIHVMMDQFLNSEFGTSIIKKMGAEKIVRIFADETGRLSYTKLVERLENHSFRKHWIQMVTQRIAEMISYIADPYVQKKMMSTAQFFINNFLKSQGVPKIALFDPDRPTETITALVNHLSKRMFGYKFDSKPYVKPAVTYIQDLLSLAEEKGIVGRGIDSNKLTDKLTDTINLEIIEPVVRVNRGYKFALKVPKCDKYVMCLVNERVPDEQLSLPGLKSLLSKSTSVVISWLLSAHTNTSFWTYLHIITEDGNCQAKYLEECHDFHVEEIKVTTEYVHSEL